jgi:hypothetical protein
VEEGWTLDEIAEKPDEVLLPMVEAVRHLARVDVDGETARGVSHGAVFPVTALGGDEPGPLAVVGPDGRLLALYEKGRAAARPIVVLTGGS